MSAPPEVGGCVSSCGARLFVVADFVSLAAAFKKATGSLTPSPALLRYCRASRYRVESLCIAAPTPAPFIRHRQRSKMLPLVGKEGVPRGNPSKGFPLRHLLRYPKPAGAAVAAAGFDRVDICRERVYNNPRILSASPWGRPTSFKKENQG